MTSFFKAGYGNTCRSFLWNKSFKIEPLVISANVLLIQINDFGILNIDFKFRKSLH